MDVVKADLSPMAITACAGSGKTFTAVRRLAAMRKNVDDRHGHIALLSFSNVAVNTFRRDYLELLQQLKMSSPHGVEIDTVDGFITSNILRPHGHLVMQCNRTPFLVGGNEPFLKSFTVFDGGRSHPTNDINIDIVAGKLAFSVGRNKKALATNIATAALRKLGVTGAYSHAAARYWSLRVLNEHPFVLKALVRRYPHVVVDEAQDIGAEHEAILTLLAASGTRLSLIGDPHQGIYDFSGANGAFLRGYAAKAGVISKDLATNFRSVPTIVAIANQLSGRNDLADRKLPETLSGAYFLPFKDGEREKTLASFANLLGLAAIPHQQAVVLCRSTEWMETWSGGEDGQGQGAVRLFAQAAICRDKSGLFGKAFDHGCAAIIGLLSPDHRDLLSQLTRPSRDAEVARLKRAIWNFIRDPEAGLPSAKLVADTKWHPLLSQRAKEHVEMLAKSHGLKVGENLGQRLAKKELTNRPLIEVKDLAQVELPPFRVSTVHKVKGESISGVMYVCSKAHAEELIGGTKNEAGRIGYVALTRARNLFVLAVPEKSVGVLQPKLLALGFKKP
ncbi:ATP-dependent helicase [Devosia sp. SL43]|nr:ATP-dependent helicase [Devosia sp. SL43]